MESGDELELSDSETIEEGVYFIIKKKKKKIKY